MELKRQYSAREVAALTGLSARQLQWWDRHRVLSPTVGPRRTPAGGFTERRYSPVELLELLVLAQLRRQGFSVQKIRRLLAALGERFKVRLIDVIGEGPLTLMTDGRDLYLRSSGGEVFNVLRDPSQPLLVVGQEDALKALSARARRRRGRKPAVRRGRSG